MSGAKAAEALRDRRILVAEDEYFIADEIAEALRAAGAVVVGPAATVPEAADLAAAGPLQGAVLDVNLNGTMIWPVADILVALGVPVLLATGYDAGVVPPAYAHLPRCEKPVTGRELIRALGLALAKPA